MFTFFNVLLGLMALINLFALAAGRYPTVRELTAQLHAGENGREHLNMALTMSVLVQIYLVSLIFPLKALHREAGLIWSVLMLLSVLETIYTARKMKAVVGGADTTDRFPLHDSRWYLIYQIAFNLAIIGACALLILGPGILTP